MFLLLLWKGLLTSWDRRKVVSWLESGSVVLLIPPLFRNACLKTFLCSDVCEDWCFCITWRVSQWLSIRRWCCLHLCPPSFSPSSRFSLRTPSPFKPFRAFPCAAESSYHCLWNQQVPRTCSTSILLCALVCPWLPEGHAALKQEPQLPRTALEMQWNELLQLIAFSLTQSPAWGLSSDMQSKLVGGKSVARSWWAHTCFIKNRPGWWPRRHESQSVVRSTFATRWPLQTGVEAAGPPAQGLAEQQPRVSLSQLGTDLCLCYWRGSVACRVQPELGALHSGGLSHGCQQESVLPPELRTCALCPASASTNVALCRSHFLPKPCLEWWSVSGIFRTFLHPGDLKPDWNWSASSWCRWYKKAALPGAVVQTSWWPGVSS